MTALRRFWPWSATWSWPWQLAIVAVVILVAAGACQSSTDEAVAPVHKTNNPQPSAISAPRSTSTPIDPPTTTRAATTTTKPRTRPTTQAGQLIPLTIAAQTHANTYNRGDDFGGWVDVDGCKDTRAVLLIRTSRVPVTFTRASACTVKTGKWVDPWSGARTTVAHDLDADHTVPLANAWRSGAWKWSHDRRVTYANDLADAGHVVPILLSENRSKGDDGPDQWKPPNPATWCRYARLWDRIKTKWNLTATRDEWSALVSMAATC